MSPASVQLICFPGAPNLPIFVAQEKGYFERERLELNMTTTPSSSFQAENLAKGTFQIAGTAFDNIVAYREGQGPVAFAENPDFFAFMGATQIELAFITAPEVRSFADLKGRTIALDALSTGFAFVLYEMLLRGGLTEKDYAFATVGATPQRWQSVKSGLHAGTLTIEPFTSIAQAQGFNVLDKSTRLFPSYQGGAFAASRAWARANPETLASFVKAYVRGLDWTLDPDNRKAATDILLGRMPEINPDVAISVMESLLSPRSGLTPKGAILADGVKTVLELRSRYGKGPALTDPARYVDLTYYASALA